MPNIGFFIWCRDDAEWLDNCLTTFRNTTPDIHLLGIANGCTDNTLEYFHKYGLEAVSFIEHHSISCCVNLGYSILFNRGYDYIGWIHPDCVFNQQGWVEILYEELQKYPQIGRICALNDSKPHPTDCELYPGAEAANLIHRNLWSLVGPYDESYIGAAYEDWDMQRRFVQHGYATYVTTRAQVWHQHAGTRVRYDWASRHADWLHNSLIYRSKWGDLENCFVPENFKLEPPIK